MSFELALQHTHDWAVDWDSGLTTVERALVLNDAERPFIVEAFKAKQRLRKLTSNVVPTATVAAQVPRLRLI